MDWRISMVGQKHNIKMIDDWYENEAFPRFIIISGDKGSGKSRLACYITATLNATISYPELGVDDIRDVIDAAYFCNFPNVYVFADADKMSTQAKNALLKVTEEPPKQAYFIITVQSTESISDALLSRSVQIKMEPYTKEELSYFQRIPNPFIFSIATTPGQIMDIEANLNVPEFLEFVNQVLDSVGTVTGVNAFKIALRFKFKETDKQELYDPVMFLRAMIKLCGDRMVEHVLDAESLDYMMQLDATMWCCAKYVNQLKLNGVRKDSTFDMWILAMRDIWS